MRSPGTLYLSFARGQYARARITRIDTQAARQAAGVVQVITAEVDMPFTSEKIWRLLSSSPK